MKRIGMTMGFLIIMLGLCMAAYAEDLTARVNIALQDGTVMIYAGAKKGVNVGDEFNVDRGGEKVGHLRVTRVKDLFSYCEIIEGEAQEMDTVIRTKVGDATAAKGKPTAGGEEQTGTRRKRTSDEEGSAYVAAPAEEKPAAESAAAEPGKSRRRDAAKKDEETGAAAGSEAKPAPPAETKTGEKAKKEDKGKDAKKESSEAKTSKKRGLPPIGSSRTAAFGLTGNIVVPSGNIASNGKGTGFFTYANSSDKNNDFRDTGFGINYGFGGDIEVSFARINTDYGGDDLMVGESMTADTNVFSFKFQLPHTKAPSFVKNVSEVRYGIGLQYYNVKTTDTWREYSESEKWKATRFFAVGTGEFMSGIGHFGVYSQTGDLVDDTDYSGFGVMGGFEYPLARGGKSSFDGMSLLLEADSKALYLDTLKTLSLGLRYTLADRGQISLSIADITSTKALLLNGGYNF